MKHYVIGIDHGYGFTKTAGSMMQSGVRKQAARPFFKDDILEFDNDIYVVGQNRTEHGTLKTDTKEYYLLTLAAIAMELKKRVGEENVKASITIGAGLPYAFMENQGEDFKKYLTRNQRVVYWFEGRKYELVFENVYLFPQGFAVIYPMVQQNTNIHALDIGSRTVDLISFMKGKARHDQCATIDKMGTLDCIRNMKKALTDQCQDTVPEELLQDFMQGIVSPRLTRDQKALLSGIVEQYVEEILKQAESYGIDLKYEQCVICGGGAIAVKTYTKRKNLNVSYIEDICANAKGFQKLAASMEKGAEK